MLENSSKTKTQRYHLIGIIMANNGYTSLNLPTALVEEMKVWRMAFTAAYAKTVSYAEIIRGMLDSLEQSAPSVVEELERIVTKHPELKEKLGNYNHD